MQDPSKVISPKVIAGTVVGLFVAAAIAIINAITPETLAFLGPWSTLAYTVVSIAGAAIAGWWKKDPLRQTIDGGTVGVVPAVITTVAPSVIPAAIAPVEPPTASAP